MRVNGRTFLVSGGGSGLGEACVRRLIERGGKVLIADVNVEAGTRLAEELGKSARFQLTDVTQAAQVDRAVEAAAALADGDGLRGAISCAGIAPGARLLGRQGPHPDDLFQRVLAINVTGTFHLMRAAAAAMADNEPDEEGERGVLINTASVAAFEGQIGQIAYAASKGAVAAMTLPAARDLAERGIRVMAIAPGACETPMVATMPDKVRQGLLAQCVFPARLGRPDEFAALVEHILTNRMLNGEVIRLDGAVRLSPR